MYINLINLINKLTSVHCAVHGRCMFSNTNIRYGLAGKNVANTQKKKNNIMKKNGLASSGVQKFLKVSIQLAFLWLAIISKSAISFEKQFSNE